MDTDTHTPPTHTHTHTGATRVRTTAPSAEGEVRDQRTNLHRCHSIKALPQSPTPCLSSDLRARRSHTGKASPRGTGRDGKERERERVPRNRLVVSRGIPSLPSYSGPDAVSAVFKAERETRGRRRIRHGPFSRRNRSRDREGVTARSKRVRVLLVRGLRGVFAVFANTSDRKLILGRKHQSQRSSREHFYF